ncbi:MAG: tRNA pseudouridine(55) synthase TruB [bacterium]
MSLIPKLRTETLSGPGPGRQAFERAFAGVLIIDKPAGMTSLDVTRRLKGRLGPLRMGHAGTLDPLATGVLPVCMGEATKLIDYMDLQWKHYRGCLQLGLETESWDVTGRIVAERPVPVLPTERLREVFRKFEGSQRQRPPAFSAVKVKGRPLYSYARKGVHVDPPARDVFVRSFDLLERRGEWLDFDLVCSRGTYVRSIVHGLGERLGCGACLSMLRRTRSGRFCLGDAVRLEQAEAEIDQGRLRNRLLSPEDVLSHLEPLEVRKESERKAWNGNPMETADLLPSALELAVLEGRRVRIQVDGAVIGVGEVRSGAQGVFLQPLRLLRSQVPDRAA